MGSIKDKVLELWKQGYSIREIQDKLLVVIKPDCEGRQGLNEAMESGSFEVEKKQLLCD